MHEVLGLADEGVETCDMSCSSMDFNYDVPLM